MPGLRREDVRPPEHRSFVTGVPVFLGFGKDTAQGTAGAVGPEQLATAGDLAAVTLPAGGALADAVRGFFANGGATCHVAWTDPGTDPVGAVRRGLAALEDLDDVDLVCLPDLAAWPREEDVAAAQRAVLEHCAARGDRFAVLDAVPAAGLAPVLRQRERLAGPDAAFGALYHPWVRVPSAGVARYVPPCGHLAGTYAAGDREKGVHRAPANRELEGVLDVAVDLADAEVGALYEAGVNPVRALPGRGIRAWGARTASDDEAWRDITVRRLVSTVGRWAERFLSAVAYEPNDVRLWVRITRELTAALELLHLSGAFAGRTAEESFYVRCDHETNPPEVVAAGLVVTEIGVAPAVPAEFIVVRVVQGADEATVNVMVNAA
ncbi:phage tail sheath family protein [Frankia sp. CNm7]|uniref:Phage tail sheath family protein n=1 Tax=Frankia nepalensis TaxID=1836974 RepID=A0A937R9P4_9ACTN|nr:phage tail sheath subtilisin-like domain-containing protein [Frankia nepalensis]MBL7494819.1 phage tail sheath family protein [Frankia nepalensis]MBL7508968.1 phage tail sheath family protein [Frankia nepalensis]MBL7524798.1 phage tail sheath family protein [Frankia nepalensis]MBL7626302.1 phage tail sheath family protein [Frankia nepalensis]